MIDDAIHTVADWIAARQAGLPLDLRDRIFDLLCVHARGVDADADGASGGIGKSGGANGCVDAIFDRRYRIVLEASE
jgi:hypothetical protein